MNEYEEQIEIDMATYYFIITFILISIIMYEIFNIMIGL